MKYRKIDNETYIGVDIVSDDVIFDCISSCSGRGSSSTEQEVQENENPEEKPVVADEGQMKPETQVESPAEMDETDAVNPEQEEQEADKPENSSEDESAGQEQQPEMDSSQTTEEQPEKTAEAVEAPARRTAGNAGRSNRTGH